MSNGPTFEAQPGWGGQVNAWLRQNLRYVVLAVVVLAVVIIWIAARGGGNENIATGTLATTGLVSTATPLPTGTTAQTVQPRDSYTMISRRAITAYVSTSAAQETNGQRLYAETILQSKIQNQPLIVGQQIMFQQSEIQSTLDSYATLTSSQKAKWESMARKVRF